MYLKLPRAPRQRTTCQSARSCIGGIESGAEIDLGVPSSGGIRAPRKRGDMDLAAANMLNEPGRVARRHAAGKDLDAAPRSFSEAP